MKRIGNLYQQICSIENLQLADKFLKHDFLQVTSEQVSHIDYIIMNPPFSADERHILHAWNIAPEGCEIISLCNWNTIQNPYSSGRTKLRDFIEKNGCSENLGSVFSTADRETNVHIGLVKLYKAKTGDNEFEGYFDMTEEEERQENGIMAYNEVRNIVQRYVGAVKTFSDVLEASEKMNNLIEPINKSGRISFGASQYRDGKNYPVKRDEFKKELQKSAWKSIFDKMNMGKYVTRSVMEDINKFVEQQVQVPFTMNNIYSMIELICLTHGNRMDKVLVQAFDKICSFSHDNSEAGEGWKTNSGYKVNQKFILPWITDGEWNGKLYIKHGSQSDDLDDIIKALCYMTGKSYDSTTPIFEDISVRNFICIREFCNYTPLRDEFGKRIKDKNGYNDVMRHLEFGTWYDWNEFFRIKGFKKGTLHVQFRSESVWMEFNRKVGKIKGWALPKQTDHKQKGTERTRKEGVDLFTF